MIYLHPSLGISNAPSTPPRITDPSYIDRIYEFVGVQKEQFNFVIEASNGTVLDDIKETRLTAHLFDAEGRELTEHLTALSIYWEEHNERWTEVGRGWSYLVNDTSRFLRLLRVRVSQLDIMTALGATIDAETKKTLAGIMVQQEVKITSSSSIYNRIPSADLIHQQLVNDVKFRELVKGDKGDAGKDGKTPSVELKGNYLYIDGVKQLQSLQGPQGIQGVKGVDGTPGAPGKDADPVRPNLLTGFMGVEKKTLSAIGTANTHTKLGVKEYLMGDRRYILSADVELLEGSANSISIGLLLSSGTFLTEAKTPLNSTKTRASLYINLNNVNPDDIIDILGYAGERGKTRGNLARYYNIKLEEVSSDTDKASAYIPHTDDLKGEPGKSPSPKEVADTINTTAWQNQIASAAASNIIQTPTLSDKIRELVQPDTTELIKRHSSRTMRHDILSKNGDKYRIIVPAFALFEPEVEDGAAVSLQVSIRQPIGSCTTPNNHDERGYFFVVESWEPIYTTSAEKICNKRGEVKVYYDSEQCAESLLSVKLERSNDHWVFVNYYDFAASIQAECTQIVPQSHYSNKSQDEMLSYAPLQYLSGKKRNAVLPTGRVGIVIRVWANKWVGDVRVRTELGESLYNTSDSTGGNIGSDGALIPAGHIGEFICINEEKIWLYTDLSR